MQIIKLTRKQAIKLLLIWDTDKILDKPTLDIMTDQEINNELKARQNEYKEDNLYYKYMPRFTV